MFIDLKPVVWRAYRSRIDIAINVDRLPTGLTEQEMLMTWYTKPGAQG
jgi:hypothetical protein